MLQDEERRIATVIGRKEDEKKRETSKMAALTVDFSPSHLLTSTWRRGVVVGGVRRMNEVTLLRARLALGWMTLRSGIPFRYATSQQDQLSLDSCIRPGSRKGENVTCVGWQVVPPGHPACEFP